MPILTAPDKKATAATSAVKKPVSKATASVKTDGRTSEVMSLFDTAALVCMMRQMYADAGAIQMHGPGISRELAKLAEENDQVAKLIDSLGAVGPYTGIVIAVMPLALQIAANHNKIDSDKAAGLGGIMKPEDLAAKVKADAETRGLEMLKAARDSQAAAQELRAEMAA